jgi:hypothetical protein
MSYFFNVNCRYLVILFNEIKVAAGIEECFALVKYCKLDIETETEAEAETETETETETGMTKCCYRKTRPETQIGATHTDLTAGTESHTAFIAMLTYYRHVQLRPGSCFR